MVPVISGRSGHRLEASELPGWSPDGLLLPLFNHFVGEPVFMWLHVCINSFPGGSDSEESTCNEGDRVWVRSLGWEDPLEKEMATHCSILPWRIPWAEEPGGLQSMGSQRV